LVKASTKKGKIMSIKLEIGKRFVYAGIRFEVTKIYPETPHVMAAISVKRYDKKPTRLIHLDQDFLNHTRELTEKEAAQ